MSWGLTVRNSSDGALGDMWDASSLRRKPRMRKIMFAEYTHYRVMVNSLSEDSLERDISANT